MKVKKMRYNLFVNQKAAIELGITNINQAHVFDLLSTVAMWADEILIEKEVYYFASRTVIASELQLLNLKPDTIYRHLKSLEKIGLIEFRKQGKKDCIKITVKGKKYHSSTISEINPDCYVGNKSEKEHNSEINSAQLGNKSEKNSERNPTYHTTIDNHTTINHNIKQKKEFARSHKKFNHKELEEYSHLNKKEKELMDEYAEIRQALKAPQTERVWKRLFEKYFKLGKNPEIIEKSIIGGYKDFFPMQQQKKQFTAYKNREQRTKEYLDTVFDENGQFIGELNLDKYDLIDEEVVA